MREIFSNSELASYNQHKTDFVLSKKMFSLNRNVSLLFTGLLKDWMAIKKIFKQSQKGLFGEYSFLKQPCTAFTVKTASFVHVFLLKWVYVSYST